MGNAALRTALEQAGHRYQTRSDTETILHAFEEHGVECLQLFRGMFAFAIWDAPGRRLFCARDRLGIKPFYYYWDGRLFAFGSEIKALLEHPAISPALAEDLLPEVLAFGYTSGDRTLFRNNYAGELRGGPTEAAEPPGVDTSWNGMARLAQRFDAFPLTADNQVDLFHEGQPAYDAYKDKAKDVAALFAQETGNVVSAAALEPSLN